MLYGLFYTYVEQSDFRRRYPFFSDMVLSNQLSDLLSSGQVIRSGLVLPHQTLQFVLCNHFFTILQYDYTVLDLVLSN